jgi:predicted acylesterase/phospholipase RssA
MASAMRASSSLPFIFQPFQYGKYLFVDGYIEHPLPIKFARYFFEEPLIVACSVLPPVLPDFEVFQPAEKEEGVDIPSMLDVFFQTNFYSQGSTVLDALVQSQPDIYITAYDSELKFWELDEVEKFYEVGKKAAEKSLEEYHSDREHTGHRKFIKHLQDRYANFRKLVKKFSD